MQDLELYEIQPLLKNRFPVKLLRFDGKPGYRLTPHWHENTELLFCIRGGGRFFCDERYFDATAGDLIVANSTEVHTIFSETGIEFFALIVYPSFMEDIETHNLRIQSFVPQDSYVKDCFLEIERTKKAKAENQVGADMLMKSYAYQLFAHLFRHYAADAPTRTELAEQAAKLKRLDMVLRYISEHFSEPIYTSELAALCYLSEGYFCRFFRKTTGRTAAEYISEYRIGQAARLLMNTNNSISEIAAKTGFDDAAYFTRVFGKYMGISPTAYRKMNKKEEVIVQ